MRKNSKTMDDDEDDIYDVVPAPKIGNLTFISKHGLEPVLKKLQKATPVAIEKLTEMLESSNEDIQLKAAETLLKYATAAADMVDKSSLARLIAELRSKPPVGMKDVNSGPIVDFGNIQDVK